jgi:hypothetical protein
MGRVIGKGGSAVAEIRMVGAAARLVDSQRHAHAHCASRRRRCLGAKSKSTRASPEMWTASSQLLVRRVCSRAATRTPRLRWTSTSRRTCAAVPCRIVVCAAACCPGVRVHALHFSLLACCVVGGMLSPTLPCLISPRPASPCVAPSRLPSALSCPVLSYPILSYPILSYPVLSPALPCPILSCVCSCLPCPALLLLLHLFPI